MNKIKSLTNNLIDAVHEYSGGDDCKSREKSLALTKIEEALMWVEKISPRISLSAIRDGHIKKENT